ncbi:hypothetical protein [Clostridioides difficile]|uniref:hypothetical protein n=1 Tax=Clostridioides difficile TaxID=1496 RepID=UPI00038C8A55|nr:hypothetical protein [Clostridioides difficile]ERM50124.1 hypothetical protein C678_1113 [Clostridioides difficile F665]ALP05126.1 hypothetical protein PCZ31_3227 [Clostridioides difficile]EQF41618.1 hypothetical protein QG3_0856 [Clostridioides difficile CD169]EQG48108.1 hypothetical protein QIW_1024 [Clostridioides difficile DA00134]EQH30273.1 hypothetical protein QM3_0994 [Clostridioides difficile DA00215]
MWYVNTKLEVEKAIESKGFILTKWYVNRFYYRVEEGLVNGFILTKWYVKYMDIKNPFDSYKFYINNVVCKLLYLWK